MNLQENNLFEVGALPAHVGSGQDKEAEKNQGLNLVLIGKVRNWKALSRKLIYANLSLKVNFIASL